MCREIIEAHHGRIRVESALGRGTTFTLKLPEVAAPSVGTSAPVEKPSLSVFSAT